MSKNSDVRPFKEKLVELRARLRGDVIDDGECHTQTDPYRSERRSVEYADPHGGHRQ